MGPLVAWSLRNGQFSDGTFHRIFRRPLPLCFVHSLITHARSRLGYQLLNWLPEKESREARLRRRRKLADGWDGSSESFSSWWKRARKHALTRERTIAWFGLTREWSRKKRTTRSCDRNFCRRRIAMIRSKSPYSRIDDRQSRYPAVCSYRGLITASAFRELYLTRVYLLKPRSQSCSRQNNIFRALLGANRYPDATQTAAYISC